MHTPAPLLDAKWESDFYSYMQFDTRELLTRYLTFIPFLRGCRRVLDLGCGRGEFLALLRDAGIDGIGVDADEGMVRSSRESGFQAFCDDIFGFLESNGERFDGVFAAHVIEHLSPEKVIELLKLCRSALSPGGTLILVTPNPASISAQLLEFWRDGTHVRPYNLELINFFMHHAGFEVVQSGTNSRNYASPLADIYRPADSRHDWPPRYEEIKDGLFTVTAPATISEPWHKRFVRAVSNTIWRTLFRAQANAIEGRLRRLSYHLICLHAPNEVFCVGRLPRPADH